MSKSNVIELEGREESADPLTELLRTGAHQLLEYSRRLRPSCRIFATHQDRRLAKGRAGYKNIFCRSSDQIDPVNNSV